jgi:small ligand-binding sensory domain FIST
MLRAGAGLSSHPEAHEAARQATAEALAAAGIDRADTVLLFFTVDYSSQADALLQTVRDVAGTDRIAGCSGLGVLTGAGEIERGPGLAVLVLASDGLQAGPIFFHPLRERHREAAGDLARTIAGSGESSFAVLLPDSYNSRPDRLLDHIQEQAGFLPVVGAGSSENGSRGKTFQVCGQRCADNALAGLVFSGSFAGSIGITQGCQPVTEPMVITKAQGNLILEIENRPAFEVFVETIKAPLLQDLRRALSFVFAGLPADPSRNAVGPGEYLVRNIIGLDPQKGILAVGEEVREGEKMIFTLRDGQRAREDLEQMLERQRENLGGKTPAFGLYFNCCARGSSLYGLPGIDTAYIRRTLGDFPLAGFFGNFELGPLGKANRMLAYTGVLLLVTES